MKPIMRVLLTVFVIFSSAVFAVPQTLEQGFVSPPDDAKPRQYWFWIYNRVDKAGITRDLEEFKAKGISGVNLITNGGYGGTEPLFGVKYQSEEWWELFGHAVAEAKRVDIELGFNLSAGCWVMLGPWVTPDNAMKEVVQADVNVDGPQKYSGKLPQPKTVDSYYRDYCVQAFPRKEPGAVISPEDIIDITNKLLPDGRLEWEVPEGRWVILRTGYTVSPEGQFKFAYPNGDTYEGGNGYQIDFLNTAAFDDHFEHLGKPILKAVRQAGGRLAYLWSDSWECGKLTWTQDFPEQFLKYRGYNLKPYLPALPGAITWMDNTASFTATANTHTLSFVGTNHSGGDNTVFIDDLRISGLLTSPDFGFEAPAISEGDYQYNPTGGSCVFGGSSGNGSGLVTNGSGFNNPNVPQGSQAAFVQGHGAVSLPVTGLIPGESYTITFSAAQRPGNTQTWSVEIDDTTIGHYEGQGITIFNDEVTRRFRTDFDRTIQDCIADNFYGHFADVCHENGMSMGSEAGGPNNIPPIDALKTSGRCDFPAGEFWVNGHYNAAGGYNKDRWLRLNLKQTASAAHIYGKRQAQAEAFTQMERDRTHWSLGPAELKPYANDAFCEGINRLMLHQATCQPPTDGKPGYEFCAGQHFTPNITWWEHSDAFFTYISRCSYMLQQGNFVGDVCFYLGEEPPTLAPPKYINPSLGAGYDCDYSNAEVLLERMSVKNGRIVLPDGMSYRLLVLQNCVSTLPEIAAQVGGYQHLNVSSTPSKTMSVSVIKKLKELVLAGATIVGEPPSKAVGLENYPDSDEEVRKVASEIWGNLDGVARTERRYGKGRVFRGKTAREILLADGISPDFTFAGQFENHEIFDYIHRSTDDAEIYFVINRTNQSVERDFTFRVAGRMPEIFDPVSGVRRPATAFQQADGRTTLPLSFDSFGSCFVVFGKPVSEQVNGKSKRNFPELTDFQNLGGPWKVSFDPAWGGPAETVFSELLSWTKHPEDGVKFYSGKATYHKYFDLTEKQSKTQRLFLDLGDVRNVAEVRLNGKELGVLWCAPWRVNITGAVKSKGNVLEIDVINLWPNRVIGDFSLPKDERFTTTHDAFRFDMLTARTALLDSGLLGPVRVLTEQ